MAKQKVKKVGIVDADLLGRDKHRFPNLVCEKISGYYQSLGATTELLMNIDKDLFAQYDLVTVSKVFTDTQVPEWLLYPKERPNNVEVGGTGFYFDKAPNLPDAIEHHMPDYHLYDNWLEKEIERGKKNAEERGVDFNRTRFMQQYREYTDYSIGFLTRGCFRKYGFCVNKKYNHVFEASPLDEFMDPTRKKLCFLDDNFLGCPRWKEILKQVLDTGKRFKFKQGLDERLLTDEKCEMLFTPKYDGDYTFAFDKISDYDLIESKLKMIRKHTDSKYIKFYVLVGFDSTDAQDIANAFKRIALLMKYNCIPYLMRYQNKNDTPWRRSKYAGMYITMARWCNQVSIFKKLSFREFCNACQTYHKSESLCSAMRAMTSFEQEYPEIAKQYFDLHFSLYR